MKYVFAVALVILFGAFQVRAEEGPPTSGGAALMCKMSRHALVTTQTLALDYEKNTVNGIPANFGPSIITWIEKNGENNEHHELNRITGTYTYWTENAAPGGEALPTFSCEKAPLKF